MKTKQSREVRMLRALGACAEALDWLAEQPSYAAAWQTCKQGDWMLWLLGRLSGKPKSASRRKVVLAACECARPVLPVYATRHPNDARLRRAIKIAEAWARRKPGVTLADVRAAGDDAWEASDAAWGDADPKGAWADAAAVGSAAAAAWADSEADAATAAGSATRGARAARREAADIVRRHYPEAPKLGRK